MLQCEKMVVEVAFRLVNVGKLDKIALPPPGLWKGVTALVAAVPRASGRKPMTAPQSGDCTMRVEQE
jgi:hypothetical protein